jgi:hypothetical protein
MLYLEQTRNRAMFMAASTIATVTFLIVTIQGINAVGVLLATAVINILVYYALPDSYSKAYRRKETSPYQ